VDAYLQSRVSSFKDLNFRPARYYLLNIKNSWDTFIQRASVLDQFAKQESPHEIFYFFGKTVLECDDDLTLGFSALATVIPQWAHHYGIKLTPLPAFRWDAFWKVQDDRGGAVTSFISRLLPSSLYRSFLHAMMRVRQISPFWAKR